MSHFSCLCVAEDPTEAMAPFCEEAEPGGEYSDFDDCTDMYTSEYESGSLEMVKYEGELLRPWIYEKGVKDGKFNPGINPVNVPYKEIYDSLDAFCEQEHGAEKNEDGWYGHWVATNPHWDWWVIGGRWSGFFLLKPGKKGKRGELSWTNEKEKIPANKVDSCRKGDIDVEGMRELRLKNVKEAWAKSEKDTPESWEWNYARKSDDTEESYIARRTFGHPCSTFAVVMDGEWTESGSMGMFGVSYDSKGKEEWDATFTSIWDSIPDDQMVHIVDCHC